MKQLFEAQQKSCDTLVNSLRQYGAALDASLTGTGKTVVACSVAKAMGTPVAVVCPKIVIPHWRRELAEFGIEPVFVLNYEKLRRGNTDYVSKAGKKMFRWRVAPDTLVVFDEVHNCKGAWTQNSQLLVAARQAGLRTLLLSATACQDPTEMRAIGYALGLHSLNKPEGSLKSWFGWMLQHRCWKDPWQNWKAGPVSELKRIRDAIYTAKGVRLTPDDLPSAFADNHIITEPLEFGSLRDIAAFYKQSGITPDIVESTLEGRSPEPFVLVEILRARQLAEAAKVPDMATLIRDAVEEGYSAAVFVNFVDTVGALKREFPEAAIIVGGQPSAEREAEVQRFQTNRAKIIIANIAAGGVGVSLHDEHGGHPRMSFISPTFNVKDYIQTLGRIHRNGAKSPSTQRVLVAANTIEEKIVEVLERKRLSLDTLHGIPVLA
jgi:superfamily II DNA or RNA helicase